MRRLALFAGVIYSLITIALSPLAHAQVGINPQQGVPHIDANGVDIIQGTFNMPQLDVSIGPKGAGGIAVTHYDLLQPYKDNFVGTLNINSGTANVWVGAIGDYFATVATTSGTTTNSAYGTGATLGIINASGTYVYTTMDGTQYVFNNLRPQIQPAANTGLLAQIIYPSGETLTINYSALFNFTECPSATQCSSFPGYRRQSITSNTGYQLIYTYVADTIANNGTTSPDYWNWRTISKITLINSAQQYYAPTANGSGFSGTQPNGAPWPSVTYTTAYTDASGSISSVTQQAADGGTWVFNSNPPTSGLVTSIQTPKNSSANITITYNPALQVQSVSNGFNTWNYAYATAGSTLTTTVTDTSNNTTIIYTSNPSLYQLLSVQDALGHTTSYSYYASGNGAGMLQKVTYPEGNSVQYSYDALENVIQTVQVAKPGSGLANITSSATYPTTCSNPLTCHKPLTTTDALNNVTSYTYDPNSGNVTNITRPAGANSIQAQTNFTYTAQTAGVMNSSGTLTAGTPIYRLTTQTTCATAATAANGSCTGSTGNADQIKTSLTYPASGATGNLLPISIATGPGTGATSQTTSMTYDALGNLLTLTDPLSHTTTYRYDAMRRQTGVLLAQAGSGVYRAVKTTYNPDGTPSQVAQGTLSGPADTSWSSFSSLQQETYLYDSLSRKIQDTASGGGSTLTMAQYTYDPEGRLSCTAQRMNSSSFPGTMSACTQSSGSDRISQNQYYADNHLQTVTIGVGVSPVTAQSFTYNPNGTTHTVADGNGNTTTYVYDGFDRVATVSWPQSHGSGSNTSAALNRTFTFDNLGRAATVTANGQTLTYAYDAYGNLTSEAQPLGIVSYTYDGANRRTQMTWPDGVSVTYAYDATNALTAISNGSTTLASFSYDSQGRRSALARGNGTSSSYGYDAISRLQTLGISLGGSGYNQTLAFQYNPASQLSTKTETNTLYAYTGYAAKNLTYGTANSLNQIPTAGSATLTYDTRGNLASTGSVSYTYDQENDLTATSAGASLTYDPIDRLHTTYGSTTGTTQFLYDGSHIIAEYTSGGTVTNRYVFGPGADEPLVWYMGSGTTTPLWTIADNRGSIIAVTNASGTPYTSGSATGINIYDEYGAPASTNLGRFQYTGQAWVPETALYHYKARTYNPNLGRFLQTDPAGYGAGLNLYAYVGNDPINNTDSTGRCDDDTVCVTGQSGGGWADGWTPLSSNQTSAGGGPAQGSTKTQKTTYTGSHIGLGPNQLPTDAVVGDFALTYGQIAPSGNTMSSVFGALLANLAEALDPQSGALGFGPGGGLGWTAPVFGELAGLQGQAAEEAGAFSLYDTSITSSGSKFLNVQTDVGASAFQANLESNGYNVVQQIAGSNGPTTILGNGLSTWSIYTRTSTGSFGAQYFGPNGIIKYSLGGP